MATLATESPCPRCGEQVWLVVNAHYHCGNCQVECSWNAVVEVMETLTSSEAIRGGDDERVSPPRASPRMADEQWADDNRLYCNLLHRRVFP